MSKQEDIIKIRFVYVNIPRRLLNRCFNKTKIREKDPARIRAFAKEAAAAIDKLRHAKSVDD